jgi:hypothetical protein
MIVETNAWYICVSCTSENGNIARYIRTAYPFRSYDAAKMERDRLASRNKPGYTYKVVRVDDCE